MMPAPLIVHVVYRFAVGGLENGVVNLVNACPRDAWRHVVVSLTDVDQGFAARIDAQRRRVASRCTRGRATPCRSIPGLCRMLHGAGGRRSSTRATSPRWRPSLPAWAAGVPRARARRARPRRDDPDGSNVRRSMDAPRLSPVRDALRRAVARPRRIICASASACAAHRIEQIYNGVDTVRFRAGTRRAPPSTGRPSTIAEHWLVGTVGRLDAVKDQVEPRAAHSCALSGAQPTARERMRLVIVGEGELRARDRGDARAKPACATSHGSPGERVGRSGRCCRGSIASCCRRLPRASRTRSSRRWPRRCRSSRRAWARTATSWSDGVHRTHRRRPRTARRWRAPCCDYFDDACRHVATREAARAARRSSSVQPRPDGRALPRALQRARWRGAAARGARCGTRRPGRPSQHCQGEAHVRHHRHRRCPGPARDRPRVCSSRMNESQHHRGPDEGGLHVEPGVGLGHRRLSIIDLSTGQQPLYNEDDSVVVVFNGEIYNYRELIAGARRARPRLPHAQRHRSHRACVGGVGRALRRRGSAACSRSRCGMRNRRYAVPRARPARREAAVLRRCSRRHLLFGSELKSLLAHPRLTATIDPCAIEEYFALGYVAEPRTIFEARASSPPAHTLSLRARPARCRAQVSTGMSAFTLDRVIIAESTPAEELLSASRRFRATAHDLGGSARRVPFGRRRLERSRGSRWRGRPERAGQHLLDRIRGSGLRRIGVSAAGRRALPDAALRRDGRERRLRPDRRARGHLRRAVCRQLGDPDLSRLPARAQARHGGAVGGRRR